MLERDPPLPAGGVGGGTGERIGLARIAAGDRYRAVTWKPVSPVFVAGAESLFDEQSAKAGAVDEQIAFDSPTVRQSNRLNVAGLAVEFDVDDLAFNPLHAGAYGVVAEVCRIEGGVEVERVAQARQGRASVLPRSSVAAERGRHRTDRPGRNIL